MTRSLISLPFWLVLLALAPAVFADSYDDARRRTESARNELARADHDLARARAAYEQAARDREALRCLLESIPQAIDRENSSIHELRRSIDQSQSDLRNIDRDLDQANRALAQIQSDLDSAQARQAEARTVYDSAYSAALAEFEASAPFQQILADRALRTDDLARQTESSLDTLARTRAYQDLDRRFRDLDQRVRALRDQTRIRQEELSYWSTQRINALNEINRVRDAHLSADPAVVDARARLDALERTLVSERSRFAQAYSTRPEVRPFLDRIDQYSADLVPLVDAHNRLTRDLAGLTGARDQQLSFLDQSTQALRVSEDRANSLQTEFARAEHDFRIADWQLRSAQSALDEIARRRTWAYDAFCHAEQAERDLRRRYADRDDHGQRDQDRDQDSDRPRNDDRNRDHNNNRDSQQRGDQNNRDDDARRAEAERQRQVEAEARRQQEAQQAEATRAERERAAEARKQANADAQARQAQQRQEAEAQRQQEAEARRQQQEARQKEQEATKDQRAEAARQRQQEEARQKREEQEARERNPGPRGQGTGEQRNPDSERRHPRGG